MYRNSPGNSLQNWPRASGMDFSFSQLSMLSASSVNTNCQIQVDLGYLKLFSICSCVCVSLLSFIANHLFLMNTNTMFHNFHEESHHHAKVKAGHRPTSPVPWGGRRWRQRNNFAAPTTQFHHTQPRVSIVVTLHRAGPNLLACFYISFRLASSLCAVACPLPSLSQSIFVFQFWRRWCGQKISKASAIAIWRFAVHTNDGRASCFATEKTSEQDGSFYRSFLQNFMFRAISCWGLARQVQANVLTTGSPGCHIELLVDKWDSQA